MIPKHVAVRSPNLDKDAFYAPVGLDKTGAFFHLVQSICLMHHPLRVQIKWATKLGKNSPLTLRAFTRPPSQTNWDSVDLPRHITSQLTPFLNPFFVQENAQVLEGKILAHFLLHSAHDDIQLRQLLSRNPNEKE